MGKLLPVDNAKQHQSGILHGNLNRLAFNANAAARNQGQVLFVRIQVSNKKVLVVKVDQRRASAFLKPHKPIQIDARQRPHFGMLLLQTQVCVADDIVKRGDPNVHRLGQRVLAVVDELEVFPATSSLKCGRS